MFKQLFMPSMLLIAGMSHFVPAHAALVVTARQSAPVKLRAPIQGDEAAGIPEAVSVIAFCAPGEKVTGGGHAAGFTKGLSIVHSGPKYSADVEGWAIIFQVDEAYPRDATIGAGFAYAMCAKET